MKKILLAILVITLLATISSCFLFRAKSVENSEFHAVIKDGELEIRSRNTYPGIEISLKGIYEEEDIITSQEHLRILFHKDGITKIAIVCPEGNIQSGRLLARVKGDFKSIQELDLQSTTRYLTDSGKNSVKENKNWVFADTTPVLLGDFDESEKVDLVDFINFARNYGTAVGDGKYNQLYDIAPAEDNYGGGWAGIYDKCEPDGVVSLLDFIIFARNYGKSKPENQPPLAPSNPTPTDGATEVSLAPILSWESGEGFIYDVYIYLDPSGEPVRSITDLTQTSYSVPNDQLLNGNTTYYWKVIASDGTNEASSPVWSFTTGALVEVIFEDDNLRQLIRNVIGKQQGPIYAHEVDDISYLGLFCQGISDLTGIEHLVGLVHLDLCWNNIDDLSPLGNLENLVTLELWDNQISDISPLASLTKLESLNLDDNIIVDLAPLSNLTNLYFLGLWRNEITDISPLGNLANLEMLLIGANQISNLTPLFSLTNLKILWVGDNPISDITQLSSMTWLEYLFVDALNLSDISFVSNLTSLSRLRMSYNQITDISPLSSLVNLNWLDLSHNQISDVEPLSSLVNLEYLYLGMNVISELSEFEVTASGFDYSNKLLEKSLGHYSSRLKTEEVYWTSENSKSNKIFDLQSISGLINLKELDVSDNIVEDITSVESLVNLNILQIQRNRVTSIEALVNNTGIGSGDQVIISDNYLDLTPGSTDMQHIQTLQNRGVYVNYVPQKLLIKPYDPSPTDGATNVSFAPTLSWQCMGATTYDVAFYLDPSGEPVMTVENLAQTSYSVPKNQALNANTIYYWKVIASDGTNELSSPIWSFTTRIPVEVVFVDPNLEQAVRDAIGKQTGPIYDYEAEGITELDASEKNISDLSGIEYLVGLTHLYLNWNQIQDLSPVSNLGNLFLLYVEGNQITDLSPILGMANLEMISVGYNPLNDITQVTLMSWLGELVAPGLGITDLSFVSQLPNLYGLHIHQNNVSDISLLLTMGNIKYLGIGWNPVVNVESVGTMTQLRYLSICGYGISDVSFLTGMTNLYQLDLRYNNITDLSPIENLTNILYLHLGHNNLTNISFTAQDNQPVLMDLRKDFTDKEFPFFELSAEDSFVYSVGEGLSLQSLASLSNLMILDLEYNLIDDITPLENLTRLYDLNLRGNRITCIEPLVNNNELGSGDKIYLQKNHLDLTPDSTDMQHIQILQNRGAIVYYTPQKQPLVVPWNPSPTDGATNVTVAPVLSWECSEELAYSIYIYLDPEGEPVKSYVDLFNTFYYIASDDLLSENATHYWRVVVTNGSDELSGPMWSFTTNSPVEVTFVDENLEGIVRDAIGKPTGIIYDYDVDDISFLTAISTEITDLSGIEYLVNLQMLGFTSCNVSDLAPLSQLVNLEFLILIDNLITDITPLGSLTKLEILLLGNNLEPRSNMEESITLEEAAYTLSDSGNSISDISPLAGLIELLVLGLEHNTVEDISALSGLVNLVWLELSDNNITDITPLIANEGIGAGDYVYLDYNYLDLSESSDDLVNIEALEGRGAIVIYEPQKDYQ